METQTKTDVWTEVEYRRGIERELHRGWGEIAGQMHRLWNWVLKDDGARIVLESEDYTEKIIENARKIAEEATEYVNTHYCCAHSRYIVVKEEDKLIFTDAAREDKYKLVITLDYIKEQIKQKLVNNLLFVNVRYLHAVKKHPREYLKFLRGETSKFEELYKQEFKEYQRKHVKLVDHETVYIDKIGEVKIDERIIKEAKDFVDLPHRVAEKVKEKLLKQITTIPETIREHLEKNNDWITREIEEELAAFGCDNLLFKDAEYPSSSEWLFVGLNRKSLHTLVIELNANKTYDNAPLRIEFFIHYYPKIFIEYKVIEQYTLREIENKVNEIWEEIYIKKHKKHIEKAGQMFWKGWGPLNTEVDIDDDGYYFYTTSNSPSDNYDEDFINEVFADFDRDLRNAVDEHFEIDIYINTGLRGIGCALEAGFSRDKLLEAVAEALHKKGLVSNEAFNKLVDE